MAEGMKYSVMEINRKEIRRKVRNTEEAVKSGKVERYKKGSTETI